MLCNFIEITFRHRCSAVNLLHIFRAPFLKNTSGRLLLLYNLINIQTVKQELEQLKHSSTKMQEVTSITEKNEKQYVKLHTTNCFRHPRSIDDSTDNPAVHCDIQVEK